MKKNGKPIDPAGFVIPAVLLVLWHLVTAAGMIPEYLFPGPAKLAAVFLDFVAGGLRLTPYAGAFWAHLWASMLRVLGGFGLAALAGLSLGLLTGRLTLARRLFDPFVHAVRAIPGIGWLPLTMVWFGIGEKTTVFLIALAAFFPIYINAAYGFQTIPLSLVRAGMVLGAGKWTLFTSVILPAAFPSILVGLRLGLSTAWAYLVLGELTGVSRGLGAVMMDARLLGRVEMIPVAMICIGVCIKLSDMLLVKSCSLFYPCREDELEL